MVKRYATMAEVGFYASRVGDWVRYEDYQHLEEENRRLTSAVKRIDTTPANEIVYPWALYSEEKDG